VCKIPRRRCGIAFDGAPIDVVDSAAIDVGDDAPLGVADAAPLGVTDDAPLGVGDAAPLGVADAPPLGVGKLSTFKADRVTGVSEAIFTDWIISILGFIRVGVGSVRLTLQQ
jgi:hypothetical protein